MATSGATLVRWTRPRPGCREPFTGLAYEAVRQRWLYDPELDLSRSRLTEHSRVVASCGTTRRRGPQRSNRSESFQNTADDVAGALCVEAARHVSDRGGRQLFINTGPLDEYPAPASAYLKVGFEVVERATRYELDRRSNGHSPTLRSNLHTAESTTSLGVRASLMCHPQAAEHAHRSTRPRGNKRAIAAPRCALDPACVAGHLQGIESPPFWDTSQVTHMRERSVHTSGSSE